MARGWNSCWQAKHRFVSCRPADSEKIREVLDSGKVCRLGGYVLHTPPLHERGAEIVIAPVRNESGIVDQAVITLLESTPIRNSRQENLRRS
ncbi:MAG: hypothetical protein CM1200mP28_15890 [Deltaproteobacteria bacterium]|nr:MAG: hypothetical protein CM1200mP28_15890 [Deltaproteobacteria bacterium]